MSGGHKQRVCIRRALAAEPEDIICDKVTSASDQIVQKGILSLLLRLQKELNFRYILITHDIATVKAIQIKSSLYSKERGVEQGMKREILSPHF
jgi:peptide/nickel transport system ATP-binding protein